MKATLASVPEVALRTFAPVVGPSVHEPTVAMPEVFVVTVSPETDPPPLTTAKVTVAPPSADPLWYFTITEGGGVTAAPATPVIEVAEFAASVVATGGGGGGGGGAGGAVDSPLQLMYASRSNAGASRPALTESLFNEYFFLKK